MKILGLILLFFSFSFYGYILGNRYILSLKEIERANFLLKNIIFCLKKDNMIVGKILENCYLECDKETKKFITLLSPKNFHETEKLAKECGFCKVKSANKVLNEAFSVLGKYSASEQICELEFCRKKLTNIYEKNEESFRSKAKLFKNLGILCGMFFVIIMI